MKQKPDCEHCDGFVRMSCIRRHMAELDAPSRRCKHLMPSMGSNLAERAVSYVLWKRHDGFKGRCVYHYTSIDTFRALLNRGAKFLCTDFRCLNDTAEFTIGFDTVISTLREVFGLKRYHEAWLRNRFDAFRADGVHGPWVMSFTENENDLYQWAAYSDRKLGGCAIGFDFEGLYDFAINGRKDPGAMADAYFGPCVYLEKNEVIFDTFLCGVHKDVFERFAGLSAKALIQKDMSILGAAWNDMMILFALIKHPCFSVEREWRFIVMPKWSLPASKIKNISIVGGKRRIALPFDQAMLRNVMISPHGDVRANRKNIDGIIKKRVIKGVKIVQSELPYRGDCFDVEKLPGGCQAVHKKEEER